MADSHAYEKKCYSELTYAEVAVGRRKRHCHTVSRLCTSTDVFWGKRRKELSSIDYQRRCILYSVTQNEKPENGMWCLSRKVPPWRTLSLLWAYEESNLIPGCFVRAPFYPFWGHQFLGWALFFHSSSFQIPLHKNKLFTVNHWERTRDALGEELNFRALHRYSDSIITIHGRYYK